MTDNQTYVNMKQRALTAEAECERLRADAENGDFVLAPKEPTVAMCRAAAPWIAHYHMMRAVDKTNAVIEAYRAMLAARKVKP